MNILGHWKFEGGDFDITEFEGFVYIITNLQNGRKYIGKKQFYFTRTLKPLKGSQSKRKRKVRSESDWQTYTGSSNTLNSDIELLGKEHFSFEILRLCKSRSELNYTEAKLQFENDVLLKDEFYNGIINVRVGKIKS